MGRFRCLSGAAHRGPDRVNPLARSHSASHPMWQLQLMALEMRLRERRRRRDSKAPGVTHEMELEKRSSVSTPVSPRRMRSFMREMEFCDRMLKRKKEGGNSGDSRHFHKFKLFLLYYKLKVDFLFFLLIDIHSHLLEAGRPFECSLLDLVYLVPG